MKSLLIVSIFYGVCLSTYCGSSLDQNISRADPTNNQPKLLINDPDWRIHVTNVVAPKTQRAASCPKSNNCWILSSPTLWLYLENHIDELRVPIEANEHLWNCFLLSSRIGWTVTSQGLIQTSDAGQSWTRISVPELDGGKGKIYAVYFQDERRGWIAGAQYRRILNHEKVPNNAVSDDRKSVLVGIVQKTVDGGLHWETTPTIKSTGRFNELAFVGATGLISGDAGLQATLDGGKTWRDVLLNYRTGAGERPEVLASFLLDEKRAWVMLSGGRVLVTHDGAIAWSETQFSAGADISFSELAFANESEGLALESRAATHSLYKTSDGGKTWIPLAVGNSFTGLAVVTGTKEILAFSDKGIYSFIPK